MIDEQTIQNMAETLLRAAPPGSKVILFGSYAAGNPRPDSDLDFLVIEPAVSDRFEEMFRLRKVLEPVLGDRIFPVDVIVMREDRFRHGINVPNALPNEALRGGRVYEHTVSC